MPIRPENRDRYPADWPTISARIRHDRARDQCECDGRCGSPRCYAADGYTLRCIATNGQPHPETRSRVVLTVAHLDHTPENCADDNLLAMCQACHLAYDVEHHRQTRAGRLFDRLRAAGVTPQPGIIPPVGGDRPRPGSDFLERGECSRGHRIGGVFDLLFAHDRIRCRACVADAERERAVVIANGQQRGGA